MHFLIEFGPISSQQKGILFYVVNNSNSSGILYETSTVQL